MAGRKQLPVCWSFTICVSNTSTVAYEGLYIDQSKLPIDLNSVPLYWGYQMLITETWLPCIGFWWTQSPWLAGHGHTKLSVWKEKNQIDSNQPCFAMGRWRSWISSWLLLFSWQFPSTLSRSSCTYSDLHILIYTHNMWNICVIG